MRPGVATCAVLALLGVGRLARGAEAPRLAARLEAGAEYDTNAGRAEEVRGAPPPAIVGSPLGRLVGTVDLAAAPGPRQTLGASAALAGKLFTAAGARPEDVAVAQAAASWSVLVAARTGAGLSLAYYDVFQKRAEEARDFRSLIPALRLEQGLLAGGLLSAGAGYRTFTYKPDSDFDFSGPTVFAGHRHLFPDDGEGGADWELAGSASLEWRAFSGTRCTSPEQCPGPPEVGRRRDRFWVLHLEATRTSSFLAGAGAALHGNRSNSYGEPLLRAVVHGRVVLLLPGELSLSARAELVATRYLDAVPLARDQMTGRLTSLEEESRSTLRLELARPLGAATDAGLRYTFYTNEIGGGPVRFRRHTALLFVAFGWER